MKTDPLSRNLDEARYRLTREIRENPLLCVGLALGVGAVIGALGSRAASRPSTHSRWLAELASELGDEASRLRGSAARAGHHASRELKSALGHVTDSVPEVDLDHLLSRGRRWLRSVLG